MSDAGNAPRQTRLERTRQRRHNRRSDASRGALLGSKVVAAALAVVVVVGAGYISLTYNNFIGNISTVNHVITQPSATATSGGKTATTDLDGKDENILLVGDDERTGATPAELKLLNTQDDGGGVNTDTLMILHVPANGSKATGISIPRDSYVNVPGLGMSKINAAYEYGTRDNKGPSGGAALLINVIQNLTGLHIDHYVAVSLLGFYRIAQALGPITVCLNNAVDDNYSQAHFSKGISVLNASQALSFVRQRHGLSSDLDREVRQQYFLTTEFRKIRQAGTLLNPLSLQKLLKAISSSLTVDPGLAGTGLLKFAEQMQNLSDGNVKFAIIPIIGTPTITTGNGSKLSIVALDPAKVKSFVQATVGVASAPPSASAALSSATAAAPAAVTVQVVNASGVDGAASKASTSLAGLGFKTVAPGSADATVATTTISYPTGMVAQAKALAKYLPGAAVVATGTGTTLTLTLGTDGLQVATTPGTSGSTGSSARPSSNASTPAKSTPAVASSGPGATPRAFGATECIN
jgi:LCP family protein required for cell wall assembly